MPVRTGVVVFDEVDIMVDIHVYIGALGTINAALGIGNA